MSNFAKAALSLAVFLAVLFAFLAIPVWWLESRFGSISAIATVGGFIGVAVFAGGAWLAMRIQSHTLNTGADFVDAINRTHQSQAGVQREYARQDREQLAAYAKFQMIDVQDSRRLARQQAGLLVDLERQKWEQQAQAQQAQPAAAWAMDDDNDGAGVRYYE